MTTGYTRDVLIPLRMVQNDERVDFHARSTAEIAVGDIERMRKLLHACREAMKISQRFNPNGTNWSHMVEAIDKEVGAYQQTTTGSEK